MFFSILCNYLFTLFGELKVYAYIYKVIQKQNIMTTRKEIMTKAHKIAKTLEGDYSARMSMALDIVWTMELLPEDMSTSLVNDMIEACDYEARAICKVVAFFSAGFQSDIAKRFLETERRLSYKQAWCIAYEFKAVA